MVSKGKTGATGTTSGSKLNFTTDARPEAGATRCWPGQVSRLVLTCSLKWFPRRTGPIISCSLEKLSVQCSSGVVVQDIFERAAVVANLQEGIRKSL